MKLCKWMKDGGPESTVSGFWLVEAKSMFSIAVLVFENGSRDAYHSHAFNSISWLLWGKLNEEHRDGTRVQYMPSVRPIITKRDTFHMVKSAGRSIAVTFRGPWVKTWADYLPQEGRYRTLAHGRKELI